MARRAPAPSAPRLRASLDALASPGRLSARTQSTQSRRDVRRKPFVDTVEIGSAAQATRELIDAAGLGEGERECTGEELIAPVDLPWRTIRQRLAHHFDEALDQRIEMPRHQLRAELGGVVHVGEQ